MTSPRAHTGDRKPRPTGRPWFRIPSWIVSDGVLAKLGPAANKVLHTLAYHANSKTDEAWPGVSTMSRETALSERTVRRALRQLEEQGIILRLRRGGGRLSARYRILFRSQVTGIERPCQMPKTPIPVVSDHPNPEPADRGTENREPEKRKTQQQAPVAVPFPPEFENPTPITGPSCNGAGPMSDTVAHTLGNLEAIHLLRSAGFSEHSAHDVAIEARGDVELVRTAIRNADFEDSRGKLQNRCGYIRRAIRDKWELLPGVVRLEREREESRKKTERRERQERLAGLSENFRRKSEARVTGVLAERGVSYSERQTWAEAEYGRMRSSGNGEFEALKQEALRILPEECARWIADRQDEPDDDVRHGSPTLKHAMLDLLAERTPDRNSIRDDQTTHRRGEIPSCQ